MGHPFRKKLSSPCDNYPDTGGTDWDDISDSFSLEFQPDYPWHMKVNEIARSALIRLDNTLCFERGLLDRIYPLPETLQELIFLVMTEPEAYPRCQHYLNQKIETDAFVRLNYLIYLESKPDQKTIPETSYLPFLEQSDLTFIWVLASHLQARHQNQAFSIEFCRQLIDAQHGLLQGLGLYLLAEAGWPEAEAMAQTWLSASVPNEEKETLLLGELYIEILSSEAERQRWALKTLRWLPNKQSITTLLNYLRPEHTKEYQLAAAESFIHLQAKSDLDRLIQQLVETFDDLLACRYRARNEIWVPQLKVLEILGDAQYLPQLIPLLPIDPYLKNLENQNYPREVTTDLLQVLQSWNLDASHPLLQSLCERQLDILDELGIMGAQNENYPNRLDIVYFLANICTKKQAKRLFPHLALDSQRLRHQWSKCLKRYLARTLTAEDLQEIEPLIRPQNALSGQILDILREAKLPGTAELIERLLEHDGWSGLRRRYLRQIAAETI